MTPLLNFLVLQWFGVRLARVVDRKPYGVWNGSDSGRYRAKAQVRPNGRLEAAPLDLAAHRCSASSATSKPGSAARSRERNT